MLLARPKAEEMEDDLLRLQDEFLSSGRSSCASVRGMQAAVISNVAGAALAVDGKRSMTTSTAPDSLKKKARHVDGNCASSEQPAAVKMVLMDVMERDTNAARLTTSTQTFSNMFQFNPESCLLKKRSPSVFAQQMRKGRGDVNADKKSLTTFVKSDEQMSSNRVAFSSSNIIDGSGLDSEKGTQLAREIHEENVKILSSMSAEEILDEQTKLKELLDARLVEFVISRHRSKARQSPHTALGVDAGLICDQIVDVGEKLETIDCFSTNCSSANSTVGQSINLGNDELPIPPSEAVKWLNMDRVERDKLLWTTSVPEPNSVYQKSGYPARFDFDGNLMSNTDNVSVYRGLHHHGEEPQRAGYTLHELFIYSRSSVLQQRVLGLNTLARILLKNGEGCFDECLVEPLVPQLLDAGLVLLIRWSLDENSMASLMASVEVLHALLVNVADEAFLDQTFCWYRGEVLPLMHSVEEMEKDISDDLSEQELKDAELVKLDVVKGFLRMDLVRRFCYILEVLRPSSCRTVDQILRILTRFARHSSPVADTIAYNFRLMNVVIRELLPTSWFVHAFRRPIRSAVKLIRVLASAGRRPATELWTKHDLMTPLSCYMAVESNSGDMSELLPLSLDALRTWKVFLIYGIGATQFLEVYPMVVYRLQRCQTLSVDVDVSLRTYDHDYAAELIGVLSVVVQLQMRDDDASVLLWQHVAGLRPILELLFNKWLWEFCRADEVTPSTLKLVGVCLSCVATLYQALRSQNCFNADDSTLLSSELLQSVFRLLESKTLADQLSLLRDHSALLCRSSRSGTDRDSKSLPSLGSCNFGGRSVVAVLEPGTPFPLLGHLVSACLVFRQVSGNREFSRPLSTNSDVLLYLRQVTVDGAASSGVARNWFARHEYRFLCDLLLLLAALAPCEEVHSAAVVSLQFVGVGDERLADEMLSDIVFNEHFVSEPAAIESAFSQLHIGRRPASSRLLRDTFDTSLNAVRDTYSAHLKMFLDTSRTEPPPPLAVDLLQKRRLSLQSLIFLPIEAIYETALCFNRRPPANDDRKTAVVHCLRFCHLLECIRSELFAWVKPEAQYSYLAMVFLVGTDYFLETNIRLGLQECLRHMADRKVLTRMNLNERPVPQIASFHDFFEQLLVQYEASSYGDRVFGSFLFVAMQTRFPLRLRRSLWSEHLGCLRVLRLPPTESELPVPLDNYLDPVDDDPIMLGCYLSALLNGQVRSPVLYLIAVHHLHAAINSQRSDVECLIARLQAHRDSDVYRHVVAGPDASSIFERLLTTEKLL